MNFKVFTFVLIFSLQVAGSDFKFDNLFITNDELWAAKFYQQTLFVTEKFSGAIKSLEYIDGKLTNEKKLGVIPNIRAGGESGLMGLAIDNDFANNKRIYICYSTYQDPENRKGEINKVDSYAVENNLLVKRIEILSLTGGALHNGCRLEVSTLDAAELFISMGDHFKGDSQDPVTVAGKILRVKQLSKFTSSQVLKFESEQKIDPKDLIPDDVKLDPTKNPLVYALGFRNPQGLYYDSESQALWSTDHGENENDEVNLIHANKNYGWPRCRGENTCGDKEAAKKSFYQTIGISNLLLYRGEMFPQFDGHILVSSLKEASIYLLEHDLATSTKSVSLKRPKVVIKDRGRIRDLVLSPDTSIIILEGGKIVRLASLANVRSTASVKGIQNNSGKATKLQINFRNKHISNEF